jgi:hypothetical protein
MNRNISHLIRASVTCAALAGFVGAPFPAISPPLTLIGPAQAANGIRAVDDLCFWENLGWDELQPGEQTAWAKLGWTAEMWESEEESAIPPYEFKDWDELNQVEQHALMDLGYTAETWESFDSNAC